VIATGRQTRFRPETEVNVLTIIEYSARLTLLFDVNIDQMFCRPRTSWLIAEFLVNIETTN
jgi:hypothetical protein